MTRDQGVKLFCRVLRPIHASGLSARRGTKLCARSRVVTCYPRASRKRAQKSSSRLDFAQTAVRFIDHSQSAGLTLTVASTVVLLDPVLDTAIEDQAIARVHRIGQSVPVQAIRLCQGDTVDETIVALQEARRGAKRQKGALSATGQLRVAELVKLFAVEEEA